MGPPWPACAPPTPPPLPPLRGVWPRGVCPRGVCPRGVGVCPLKLPARGVPTDRLLPEPDDGCCGCCGCCGGGGGCCMKSVADGRWRRRLVVGEETGAEAEDEDEAVEEEEDPPTLISPSSGSEYDRFFMAVVGCRRGQQVKSRLACGEASADRAWFVKWVF